MPACPDPDRTNDASSCLPIKSTSFPSSSIPSTTLFSANAYVLFHGNFPASGSTLQNRPMRVSCIRYSKACRTPFPKRLIINLLPVEEVPVPPPHSGMREFWRVCGGVVYGAKIMIFRVISFPTKGLFVLFYACMISDRPVALLCPSLSAIVSTFSYPIRLRRTNAH